MVSSNRDSYVQLPCFQSWRLAAPPAIMCPAQWTATRRDCAIAPQQNGTLMSCRDLCVSQPCIQRWNFALAIIVRATSYSRAIAPEQNCMSGCRDLSVSAPSIQSWDVAPAIMVPTTSQSHAITPEKDCMACTCHNHSHEKDREHRGAHRELEPVKDDLDTSLYLSLSPPLLCTSLTPSLSHLDQPRPASLGPWA